MSAPMNRPQGVVVARMREALEHVLDVQRRIHEEEDALQHFDDLEKVSTMLPSGRLVQLNLGMIRRALGAER